MREREDLQTHLRRLAGYERRGVAPEVRLEGPQHRGSPRIELAVRGAQPAALHVGLLAVGPDFGDSGLEVRVCSGRFEPQVEARRTGGYERALEPGRRVRERPARRNRALPRELAEAVVMRRRPNVDRQGRPWLRDVRRRPRIVV